MFIPHPKYGIGVVENLCVLHNSYVILDGSGCCYCGLLGLLLDHSHFRDFLYVGEILLCRDKKTLNTIVLIGLHGYNSLIGIGEERCLNLSAEC